MVGGIRKLRRRALETGKTPASMAHRNPARHGRLCGGALMAAPVVLLGGRA